MTARPPPRRALASGLALALVVAAVAIAATPVGAQGGGQVVNVDPTIEAFTSQSAVSGRPTRLFGAVADGNGEADVAELSLTPGATPPGLDPTTHTVLSSELAQAAEPAASAQGWRVWDDQPGDGLVSWSYQWTPPTTGQYTWDLTVTDEAGDDSQQLQVTAQRRTTQGQPPSTEEPAPSDPPGPGVGSESEAAGADADVGEALQAILRNRSDLTWAVSLWTDPDGRVNLAWPPVGGAMGYQVWRSQSPYELRGELDAAATAFSEPAPIGAAHYKVTFFTARDAAHGWAPDGAAASAIPGWEDASSIGTRGVELDLPWAPPPPSWPPPLALVAAGLALGGAALAFAGTRGRRQP